MPSLFPTRLLLWLCLLFSMPAALAAGTPAGTVITNTATFDDEDGSSVSNTYSLTVQEVCAPALTPQFQTRTVRSGEVALFAHTLSNTGNAAVRYSLEHSGEARIYLDQNGNGKVDPAENLLTTLLLEPDASVRLLLAGLPPRLSTQQVGRWTMSVACPNPGDGSIGVVDTLFANGQSLILEKTLMGPAQVLAGEPASYTLSVSNPNLLAVAGTEITDLLPAGESFVSSTPAPTTQDAQGLHWLIGTLQAGERRSVTLLTTTLKTVPDDTLIVNTATASSTDLSGSVSASASLRVFTTSLLLQKTVQETVADTGDRLHYRVTVSNPSKVDLRGAEISDTPDAGLSYLPGSSQLDGQQAADPLQAGRTLTFAVGRLAAGQTRTVSYVLQATPAAAGTLGNVASASALGASSGEAAARVISNLSRVQVTHRASLFGGRADLIGRVYVDRSRSGHYVEGSDTPVPGARIVLAGGQEALSDGQGRYHFASLPPGRYALRLDPRSAPWEALPWPGDEGRTGSRLVDLQGLTSIDFPLRPNVGGAR